jgi:hypothetical protein
MVSVVKEGFYFAIFKLLRFEHFFKPNDRIQGLAILQQPTWVNPKSNLKD